MNLIKILIPSWRFFDRAGDISKLYYRLPYNKNSQWQLCLLPPKIRPWHLFINPEGNLYLASQSAVDRLLTEMSEDKKGEMTAEFIEHRTSFTIVNNLVKHQLKSQGLEASTRYQFMIEVEPENNSEKYQALISSEYQLT